MFSIAMYTSDCGTAVTTAGCIPQHFKEPALKSLTSVACPCTCTATYNQHMRKVTASVAEMAQPSIAIMLTSLYG